MYLLECTVVHTIECTTVYLRDYTVVYFLDCFGKILPVVYKALPCAGQLSTCDPELR